MAKEEEKMNEKINQLIQFALENKMIEKEDVNYSINLLLDLFKIDHFEKKETEPLSLYDILNDMLDYACKNELITDDVTSRDLFDTRIMNCVMPRPSEVIAKFYDFYEINPQKATDYYYDLSLSLIHI